jgi:O-antigen ligase
MTSSSQTHPSAHRGILFLLGALVLVVPLLFSPNLDAWRGVKPVTFELLALALLTLVLLQASVPRSAEGVMRFLRIGPHQPILMLVLYGAVSWYRSPAPALSAAEWLRLACGAGLYFVITTVVRQQSQVRTLVGTLTAVAIVTSLIGLSSYSPSEPTSISSTFGNGQLLSGFLLLLMPLLLALAFNQEQGGPKIVTQAAVLLVMAGLLLARTRSSWLGSLVALAALAWMSLCYRAPGRQFGQTRHRLVVPAIIVVGALGAFVMESRTAPLLVARAASFSQTASDPSLAWRVDMWKGAWKLIRERPQFGWGIGTFPLEQARTVSTSQSTCMAPRGGPTLGQEAHNEYLQMAAETGLLGLGLYLWVLGAFFVTGIRALRRIEAGFRQLVLMGCLAAIAGQVVDALSNPAWRFADVSFVFWLVLGLGVAVAQMPRRSLAEADPARSAGDGRASGRLIWQGAMLALGAVAMSGAWAATQNSSCPQALYPNSQFDLRLLAGITTGSGTASGPFVEMRGPVKYYDASSATVSLCSGACVTFQLQYKVHGSPGSFQDVPLQCAKYQTNSATCLTQQSDTVVCNTCNASQTASACGNHSKPLSFTGRLQNGPTQVTATVQVKCSGCSS